MIVGVVSHYLATPWAQRVLTIVLGGARHLACTAIIGKMLLMNGTSRAKSLSGLRHYAKGSPKVGVGQRRPKALRKGSSEKHIHQQQSHSDII
jgi:hypothetical protein